MGTPEYGFYFSLLSIYMSRFNAFHALYSIIFTVKLGDLCLYTELKKYCKGEKENLFFKTITFKHKNLPEPSSQL